MSLLALPGHATYIADPCWMCVPGADGPPCRAHAAAIREAATAQAQHGYGLPTAATRRCTVCRELRYDNDPTHDCWSQLDDDQHKRRSDV